MKNIFKILLFTFFVFAGNEVLNHTQVKAAECTVNSGVLAAADVNSGCQTEPDSYGIVIYELWLCTSAPTAPTTSSALDLSNCEQIFANSDGSSVSLTTGGSVNLSGTQTLPSPGTYTHGVVKMNNTFAITAAVQLSTSYNGQVSGSGVYCATVDGSGASASTGDSTDRTVCGSSPLTAGTYTETLTSFGTPFDATANETNIAGTGANIDAYLVDSDEFLATADANVNNLHGVVEFASSSTITASTSSVTISFNVGEGMSVDGAGSMYMGSGPFQATITVN